jgi:hypothetical protein
MRPSVMASVVGVSALMIGLGLGYKIAERRLSDEFDARLEKETAGMREFYQSVKKPYATPQEAAAALIDDDEDTEQESTATVVGDKIAYHKIVKKNYAPMGEEILVDFPEQDDRSPTDEIRHQNLFVEHPHIISQEEFMQNDSDYNQSTLTFYRGDHVLTDERENVIDDLNEVVGADNMLQFGTNSSDPNVLHIRNGRLQMEFEVCLSEYSYRQEILGIEENPPQLPSGRKRS